MSTIVTRAGKGSALTHTEVDANFTNLNTDKLQSGNTAASLTITNLSGTTVTYTNATISSATISGGTINSTTVGATTPAAGTFTSLSDSGNLTFTGTGNRILGDFSNATVANRVIFQTSTTNGVTQIQAMPNGTATQSQFTAINGTDPNNASGVQIRVNATEASVMGYNAGTGASLPLNFLTGGSERMRIDTSGNVQIGTTTADGQVHIKAAAGQGVPLTLTSTDAGGNPQVVFKGSRTYQIGTGNASSGFAGQLFFYDGTAAATRMLIDSSGNLLIGKTTTDNATNGISWGGGVGTVVYAGGSGDGPQIQVVNTTASGTVPNGFRYFSFRLGATATEIGTITKASATTVAYNTSSDYRLKYDIAPMTGALEKVKQLKPCTYKWHEDDSDGEGFIAHELAEVCPYAVTGEKDAVNEDGSIKPQGIDTSFLVATLTAAIQEQQQMIETLQAKVAALEEK